VPPHRPHCWPRWWVATMTTRPRCQRAPPHPAQRRARAPTAADAALRCSPPALLWPRCWLLAMWRQVCAGAAPLANSPWRTRGADGASTPPLAARRQDQLHPAVLPRAVLVGLQHDNRCGARCRRASGLSRASGWGLLPPLAPRLMRACVREHRRGLLIKESARRRPASEDAAVGHCW
jgi:hypothetical protein